MDHPGLWITVVVMTAVLILADYLIRRKVLGKSRKPDGYLDVSATDSSQIYQLEIDIEPEELKGKTEVIFKVRKISDE